MNGAVRRWLAAAACLVTWQLAFASPVKVQVEQGQLMGQADASGARFLGIPYAQAPVADLRWRAPAPARPWSGVRDAARPAAACPQTASAYGPVSVDEDCLYLNVFTPPGATPGAALPVFVWLHGGAFISGTGGDFDASVLAAAGPMLVVTINYRLGILGFLSHAALSQEDPKRSSGNYGLQDQQAALRWLQSNIARFGGDPQRVTLAGQSAGGLSVLSHLASPGSAGLFHRAIVQSGTYRLSWPKLSDGEAKGKKLADAQGCKVNVASCLRALPVEQVLAAQEGGGNVAAVALSWGPMAGTSSLPTQPLQTFRSGRFNQVPVLIGNAHDEGRLFTAMNFDEAGAELTASAYPAAVKALVGGIVSPLVVNRYPLSRYASPSLAYAAVFGDSGFACQGLILKGALSAKVPTQVYELTDSEAGTIYLSPKRYAFGATHTSDVPLLFPATIGHGAVTEPKVFSPDEVRLAGVVRALWASFARDGRAGGPGLPDWPIYSASTGRYLSLGLPAPVVSTGLAVDHQCSFWKPLVELASILPSWLTGAPF
jgi:para-nitrobenzyl esterase